MSLVEQRPIMIREEKEPENIETFHDREHEENSEREKISILLTNRISKFDKTRIYPLLESFKVPPARPWRSCFGYCDFDESLAAIAIINVLGVPFPLEEVGFLPLANW